MALGVIAPLEAVCAESVNQCIDRCFGSIGDVGASHVFRDACLAKCNQSSSYGAIAYSPETGHFGWHLGRTEADAKQSALENCWAVLQQSSISVNDCETDDNWFQAPWCGSIAQSGDGTVTHGAYAIMTGVTGQEASRKALTECRKQGGADCAIAQDMPQCAN